MCTEVWFLGVGLIQRHKVRGCPVMDMHEGSLNVIQLSLWADLGSSFMQSVQCLSECPNRQQHAGCRRSHKTVAI